MTNPFMDANARAGVAGGLMGTLLATISSNEAGKTIVLAAMGTITSFIVSLLLKKATNTWKNRR